jgi:hypothetical protein
VADPTITDGLSATRTLSCCPVEPGSQCARQWLSKLVRSLQDPRAIANSQTKDQTSRRYIDECYERKTGC